MKKAMTLAAMLAYGCAVQYPQNAHEFRQQIPSAYMGQVKSFEAKRPFRDVARTFQTKGPECLNVAVRMVEHGHGSASNVLTTYKPTVLVSERKAELHVQRTMKGNIIVPGKVPDGGMYFLVADATPIDKGRTKVDIYGPSRGADALTRAVESWATGANLGCPDMTKN